MGWSQARIYRAGGMLFTTTKQTQSWSIKATSGSRFTFDWGDGTSTATVATGADQTITKDYGSAGTRVIRFEIDDPSKLLTFNCSSNNLIGRIPSFEYCQNLTVFNAVSNGFTGSLPSFSRCTKLSEIYCYFNSLSGVLPSFSTCTNLIALRANNNAFSGTIPSFSACTKLLHLYLNGNAFSGYTQQTFATTSTQIALNANQLPVTSVNQILVDLASNIASHPSGGFLDLSGTNAAPTGEGLTAKATIAARPWTVTTA